MEPVEQYGQVLWVTGSPIDHTLSPAIHNAAFERAGLPHRYFAMEVSPRELEEFIDVFRTVGALGVNFTLPLKETICEIIDSRTEAVDRLGAANTLYRENGQLKLDNTDVYGFKQLVGPWHSDIEGGSVLVLGAGGAARACVFALDQLNCRQISIWNRTNERAEKIRDEFSGLPIQCLTDEQLEQGQFDAEIVVNATSLGLDESDPSPISESAVREGMVGVDLIYNRTTAFMELLSNRGEQAVGGLDMLVHQAARAWERWVGEQPNVDAMLDAARTALR